MAKKNIFFAYQGGHGDNIDAIKVAARDFNHYQKTYHVMRWEDLSVSGYVIGKKITDEIDNCEIFACDLTYLNHNVFFELGYAVAKKKELIIFLNTSIKNAKENYSNLDILRNIGYVPFCNSKDILNEFQKRKNVNKVLIDQLVMGFEQLSTNIDVFFINGKNTNQASIDLESFFLQKRNDISIVTNSPTEISYQPLRWYLTTIKRSCNVVLHMLGTDKEQFSSINAEYSLYAGIAYGFDKNVVFLAPDSYVAPIDYTDMLISYYGNEDCIEKIEYWFNNQRKKIPEKTLVESKSLLDTTDEYNLLKLGIGIGIAEKESLQDCFVETAAYETIKNKGRLIVEGRKGTGKTEIFLRLQQEFKNTRHIFNIVLKPESVEMIGNVEFANLYNTERSKRAFFTTIWKYIIISKLFFALYDRKDVLDIDNKLQNKIEKIYSENIVLQNLNFYSMILYINEKIGNEGVLNNPNILEKINKELSHMEDFCFHFFQEHKYQEINILADNLDTGWDSTNDLTLQADMLVALIEYTESLGTIYKNTKVLTKLFLRKDIYVYILGIVREADKLQLEHYEIDWNQFPEQLKLVLEQRFKFAVNDENFDAQKVWAKYFRFKGNKSPFEFIVDKIVKRPRDIIYFVSRLFESAINNNRSYVIDDDFKYANEEYMRFLYRNLISELKAEFSEIERLLTLIEHTYTGSIYGTKTILYTDFYRTLLDGVPDEKIINSLIKRLVDNNYLFATIGNEMITNYEVLQQKLIEPKFHIFKLKIGHKNKIYVTVRLKSDMS